jgi:hypothetical protein
MLIHLDVSLPPGTGQMALSFELNTRSATVLQTFNRKTLHSSSDAHQ